MNNNNNNPNHSYKFRDFVLEIVEREGAAKFWWHLCSNDEDFKITAQEIFDTKSVHTEADLKVARIVTSLVRNRPSTNNKSGSKRP